MPDGHSGKPWDAFRRWRKGQRGFVHTAHELAKGQNNQFLNLHQERGNTYLPSKWKKDLWYMGPPFG